MNYSIKRLTKPNKDFEELVSKLDRYLAVTDQDEHEFYDQFNSIEKFENIVIAYLNNTPVGCGAFKQYDPSSVEIKRMYVEPQERGSGLASKILSELEVWSIELSFKNCILETGKRQIEAVNFYKKSGYYLIPKYGQYQGMENSLCFKKEL